MVVEEEPKFDVTMVRAVVEFEDKFKPGMIQFNRWETAIDGNPFIRSTGENFIDPSAVWLVNFKHRTALIQKREAADEGHGWCCVKIFHAVHGNR